MAMQSDAGGKDEIKTQFVTREGTYRLMTLSEYSRPNRVGYTNSTGSSQVRVSLVTLPPDDAETDDTPSDDRVCFNHGKELYVYVYRGVKKAVDLTKPIDKKIYKGTNPTCHDFNSVTTTADGVSLVIGFSTGQIQLIDPIKKELSKLYNEERFIDKTKVTCIKWIPGSSNLFLASHASGQLYLYNEELSCGTTAPHYQLFKQGDSYSIYTCRTKSTRNPLYRWVVGAEGCSINEFSFSPCGTNLAVASQDGFLRVFHYNTMELIGRARSYFGGFLCVCWSPDGNYVVVGGEDDLITVWSFAERKVIARGQGHRSWVSVVAFDPYILSYNDPDDGSGDNEASKCEGAQYYRLGSVSQDTQLCLWDLTEDILRPPVRARASTHLSPSVQSALSPNGVAGSKAASRTLKTNKIANKLSDVPTVTQVTTVGAADGTLKLNTSKPSKNNTSSLSFGKSESGSGSLTVNSLTQRFAGFSFGDKKEHRRNVSLNTKLSSTLTGDGRNSSASNSVALRGKVGDPYDTLKIIGTPMCPRFDECPVMEPLICKKIAVERLTALIFREECFVTACQDGCVYTWARPSPPTTNGHAKRLHLTD